MKKYTEQENALMMFNRFYEMSKEKGIEYQTLVIDMKQAFLELPSIEVEDKVIANWMPDREWYYDDYAGSDYQRDCFTCSRCGRTVLYKQPHCHCGAEMLNYKEK
jgi:hypothetical protein